MYNDVSQRNFGKARMESYLSEAQTRRLVAEYEARETKKSLPKIKVPKSSFQRFLDWLFRGGESAAGASKSI